MYDAAGSNFQPRRHVAHAQPVADRVVVALRTSNLRFWRHAENVSTSPFITRAAYGGSES